MRFLERLKEHILNHVNGSSRLTRVQVVALVLLAFTIILFGVVSYFRSRPKNVVWQGDDSGITTKKDGEKKTSAVHVAGEVLKPGVYDLKEGDRVQKAIEAAGGPSPDADLNGLNLARKVKDGEQIMVPARVVGGMVNQEATGMHQTALQEKSVLNLNMASEEELQELPGIGPTLAERIVKYRKENGPFSDVNELTEVPGIGEKKLKDLEGLVTTG